MEEKNALSYCQHDRCLSQMSVPNFGSNFKLSTSRSSLILIVVLTLLLLLCLFICCFTLSMVFVLSNKVQMLEARLDESFKHPGHGSADSESTEPTKSPLSDTSGQANDANATAKRSPNEPDASGIQVYQGSQSLNTRNQNKKTEPRTPRNAGSSTSAPTCTCQEQQMHSFTHLSGVTGWNCRRPNEATSRYVSWYSPDALGYQQVSTNLLSPDIMNNTFIPVLQDGYYHVYAQLTYHNERHGLGQLNGIAYGFEVVRFRCSSYTGPDSSTVLLDSSTTQSAIPNNTFKTDSSYVGGVFQLNPGDFLAVRKKQGTTFNLHTAGPLATDTQNYFGAMLMHAQSTQVLHHSCAESHLFPTRAVALCPLP